jgi:hypothetical protein
VNNGPYHNNAAALFTALAMAEAMKSSTLKGQTNE